MKKILHYFDLIGVRLLIAFRKLLMWKRKIDVEEPIALQKKFKKEFSSPDNIDNFVLKFFSSIKYDYRFLEEKINLSAFLKDLQVKAKIFDRRPYQTGGLDVEINLIVALLAQYKSPSVLEVGVANGFSSACLYKTLNFTGGSIVSVDLPRMAEEPKSLVDKVHARGAKRGFIKNTGTIIDLNPGGVIPHEKYAGWMVPMELRESVNSITLFGDIFNVIEDINKKSFDFIVIDAMKDYESRFKLLEFCNRQANENCIIIFDGYWVNSAFNDFCKKFNYPFFHIGKVGVFQVKRGL